MVLCSLVMGCSTLVLVVLSFRFDAGRRPLRSVARGIYTDRQLLSAHPRFAQAVVDVFRHTVGKPDDRMAVEDLDAADVHRVDSCFVGDGADDVAGLHPVLSADFDAITDVLRIVAWRARPMLALAARLPLRR